MSCTDFLKRCNVASLNTESGFDLERYIERDTSKAKNHAMLWGRGDFKTIIRNNMKGYYDEKLPGDYMDE